MSTIERHTSGTVSWVDLMTPDPEGARAFYGSLFGWTFDVGPAEVGFYTRCNRGGRRAAGMGKLPEGAQALGGNVCVPPFETPYGRTSIVADPWGATFHMMTLTKEPT